MKPEEETNQSNSAQDDTQRQKEQEERNINWRSRSKKEIYLLEKMGMRIRVRRPDHQT